MFEKFNKSDTARVRHNHNVHANVTHFHKGDMDRFWKGKIGKSMIRVRLEGGGIYRIHQLEATASGL